MAEGGRSVKRNCAVSLFFIVGAIFIFLIYAKATSLTTHTPKMRYPKFASYKERAQYSDTTSSNSPSTTTSSKTGVTSSSKQTTLSTVTSTTSSTSSQSTPSMATRTKSQNILFAKDEPKTLSPVPYDKSGVNPHFKRITTPAEIKHYVDLLRKIDELFKKNGLQYFIYSGTLLGSYRHFGFIPWDDDIDIFVPHSQREQTKKVLNVPGFECVTDQGHRWKFNDKRDKMIRSSLTWRWPFVDISFFKETKDTIWDTDTTNFGAYVYKKEWVFPLTKRPFEGYWFYAPKDTKKCIEHNVDLSVCVTGNWNHRHEHGISKKYREKCDTFRPYYAFVNRTTLPDGKIKEALTFESRVLQEVVFDHP